MWLSYFYWLTLDYMEDSLHPQITAGLLQLTLRSLTWKKNFVPRSEWSPAFPKSVLITARQHNVPAGAAFDMSYTSAGLLFSRKTSSLQFLHFPRCSKSHQGRTIAMQPTLQQRLAFWFQRPQFCPPSSLRLWHPRQPGTSTPSAFH